MSETVADQSANLPRKRLLLLYSAQLVLATAVLGLDSYGIQYVQYHALIYSLTVAVCTLLVCTYLLTSLIQTKLFNLHIAIGLQFWMLIFWAVNTGLLADLANTWSQPGCTFTPWDRYACSSYNKRDPKAVYKRETSYRPYFASLVAGVTFSGLEILMWVCTTALLLCNVTKRRSNSTELSPSSVRSEPADCDLEKQQTEHNIWDHATASALREGPQPLLPPASPETETERIDTYPFLEPCEQASDTMNRPFSWTNHHARMSSVSSQHSAATGPLKFYMKEQIANTIRNQSRIPEEDPVEQRSQSGARSSSFN